MTHETHPEVDSDLDELSLKYAARLVEKMRELTALVERACAGENEALAEAYKIAHTLHGTAGSYGFHQVSTAAKHLEAELKPAVDGQGAANGGAVKASLRELAREVEAVSAK